MGYRQTDIQAETYKFYLYIILKRLLFLNTVSAFDNKLNTIIWDCIIIVCNVFVTLSVYMNKLDRPTKTIYITIDSRK